ncbi:helix-turn-helix transcriptional regulator [Agrobacterium tumefaciens]|uniref:helix-turn-helix transcriptional regulator n=1 Tax=Agrobacterium tumefaciens TaxID=358 RepID=UPI001571828D|nr:helix-turn-helix domain-containing protein [Agrobacterium tumefaciens]
MTQEAAGAALLTDADLAKRWGVSAKTIKRWRSEGKTPESLKIGRRGGFGQGVRYRIEDVIAFEEKHRSAK